MDYPEYLRMLLSSKQRQDSQWWQSQRAQYGAQQDAYTPIQREQIKMEWERQQKQQQRPRQESMGQPNSQGVYEAERPPNMKASRYHEGEIIDIEDYEFIPDEQTS